MSAKLEHGSGVGKNSWFRGSIPPYLTHFHQSARVGEDRPPAGWEGDLVALALPYTHATKPPTLAKPGLDDLRLQGSSPRLSHPSV